MKHIATILLALFSLFMVVMYEYVKYERLAQANSDLEIAYRAFQTENLQENSYLKILILGKYYEIGRYQEGWIGSAFQKHIEAGYGKTTFSQFNEKHEILDSYFVRSSLNTNFRRNPKLPRTVLPKSRPQVAKP